MFSESPTLEFKREYVPDINKTVVAFANTNGGAICVRIDDNENAVGVSDVDNVILQIGNSIRDSKLLNRARIRGMYSRVKMTESSKLARFEIVRNKRR